MELDVTKERKKTADREKLMQDKQIKLKTEIDHLEKKNKEISIEIKDLYIERRKLINEKF